MGREVSFVLDRKEDVHVGREALLDVHDSSASAEKGDSAISSQKPSSSPLRDFLPTLKDAVKLALFCAVTVAGMTVISQVFPKPPWSNKPHSAHETHGSTPVIMDSLQSNFHNTSLSMDFTNPTKFSFTQVSRDNANQLDPRLSYVKTLGSIEVRNTGESTGSYIHVDLDIRGSDSRLTSPEALGIAKTDSSLVLKTPKRFTTNGIPNRAIPVPCLYISAVITINSRAKLEKLGIDSASLAVIFRPGLDYAESRVVETKARFDSASTYSRETVVNVNSASVTGSFPLYDLLSIHTDSGSINVDILPKNASRAAVKPAVLRLNSNSGSIRNSIATNAVPKRDYQTSISTSSGSIEAQVLHGLRTSLRSINGRITAHMYPYGHNDSRTDIEVHCTSGGIAVTLHPSISHPTTPLKKLYGYYRGVSGSLSLFYPAQWQGTVVGNTLSGGVNLDWQGLRTVKDRKDGHVKRQIEAVRGKGEGKLEFHSSSGSVQLRGESGGL